MDPRSREFLERKSIKKIFHIPKKIKIKTLKNYDLVLSMDQEIYRHVERFVEEDKHFLYNHNDPKEIIIDPIGFLKIKLIILELWIELLTMQDYGKKKKNY